MHNRLGPVFESFRNHDVQYVVLGGVAAILHGVPRTTFDLDILIAATRENAERLLAALDEAGFATAGLTSPDDVLSTEITVFRDYVRIDVQTSTPGLAFEAAWDDKAEMSYQGTPFYVVSREHLIASKTAAGRPVDLEDVRVLRALGGGAGPR